MDKLLLDIFCPATSARYDFWVPCRMPVAGAREKIAREICAYEQNAQLFGGEVALFSCRENAVLDPSGTMEQSGVRSGDRILIV